MLEQILKNTDLIFYLLAAEVLFLCLLQIRTNHLLRKTLKVRAQKKETVRQLKEEVKNGESKIPVVKFEKVKEKPEPVKKPERSDELNEGEMAVFQELMTEFFG